MGRKRNDLEDLELRVAAEIEIKRRKRKKQPIPEGLEHTNVGKDIRKGKRRPIPVPKNKSLAELLDIDPDHPELRHAGQGAKRKYKHHELEPDLPWRDQVRKDGQQRYNERRGRARKYEAQVVTAVRTLDTHTSRHDQRRYGVGDEDLVIAQGILSLEDWDNEELIRGYRRGRNGKFGPRPRFISQEVQQEAFRRLVTRGDRKMKQAYIKSIEDLIYIAQHASSEKVQLDAIRELQNRIVGKVPERVHVGIDQPWEDMLADSISPISELPPIEMVKDDDGVVRMETQVLELPSGRGGEDEAPSTDPGGHAADTGGRVPIQDVAAPSPPRRKKSVEKKRPPVSEVKSQATGTSRRRKRDG